MIKIKKIFIILLFFSNYLFAQTIEPLKNYSLENILENDEIDAVIIATPIETHYKIAKDFLNANKHVLIEKPITASSKEALDLIKTAEKNKKVLMVDHTFEFSSPIEKIKEIFIFYIKMLLSTN